MKRRGRNGEILVFGEGYQEWTAPAPVAHGGSCFQASAYRHLVLSSDGISKLRAIRKGLADEARKKASSGAGK